MSNPNGRAIWIKGLARQIEMCLPGALARASLALLQDSARASRTLRMIQDAVASLIEERSSCRHWPSEIRDHHVAILGHLERRHLVRDEIGRGIARAVVPERDVQRLREHELGIGPAYVHSDYADLQRAVGRRWSHQLAPRVRRVGVKKFARLQDNAAPNESGLSKID